MRQELECKMNLKYYVLIAIVCLVTIPIVDSFAEESETIEVEIKYTNGDRADHTGMKLLVYQDTNKDVFLEKQLGSNPDFILVPENHRYKIEVYVNGIYAGVEYVQLKENSEKTNISIPLSGGIQFEVYYNDGQTPIEDATVVIKSSDNTEIRRATTNDQGKTLRYWIQSTTIQDDHYVADVFLEDLFLKSDFPIKIQPGISTNKKIVTNIPEIVEDLITVNLFEGSKKITSDDGEYVVVLVNFEGEKITASKVDFRGDSHFSSIKSGTYIAKISTGNEKENSLWPETAIQITGEINKFNIFRDSEKITEQQNPFYSCNCISFRLDDVQDFWLADTQIELIELFAEKNIPLTVGIIGSVIGQDERITTVLKENNENIEIVNHSWNNDVLVGLSESVIEQYVLDTNQKIAETFDVTPTLFIPPENLYDDKTIKVLKDNGFTHLSAHIDEKHFADIDEESFFKIPATTETAKLDKSTGVWDIREKEYLLEQIIEDVEQNGYAIVMMHPQEFSLNQKGEYDSPNQSMLADLSLLLDEIKNLDSRLVKISEIEPISEPEREKTIDSEETIGIQTCNCVAFRLDGVQDYWLNQVQLEIMKTFTESKTPLTIGIIANAFGNDNTVTEFVKSNVETNKNLEIATKGVGVTSYTEYDKNTQSENLRESLDLIESILNTRPSVFIPPNNKFNSDTFEILSENNITHISSSLVNGDSPPFEFKGKEFYRFPQTTSTGQYVPDKNVFEGLTSKQIIDEAIQSINNFGFAVISIQPQEFSNIENSTYINSVNAKQIDELKSVIDELNNKEIKIVTIGKINSNLVTIVWIKNNAGWWAEGAIDDETFVQGVEYLVKNGIISVSEKSQTSSEDKGVLD
ncbi:phosphonate ABC transporter periplasmic phosphonate-binding protein [Marine Group I thaumarchaeote SCGC AAA799-P11]|uniref:Phosphonate ABC transporter periplasmic phosphonate-binding protein n=1 Tax=Marine Group I thaumarchaeote SCGC AAA799-P11 TaxID=1502295 RepID=A0A087S2N1_9ARCH|nr:phosphonate ABC transporter periplasmic phosphonate-binding protein [Marine Group I thaumarchaeote SCGC AAA799-P11]